MIAVITTLLYGLDLASVHLDMQRTILGETTRRVSRIPTLDGGVAVNDFGSTAADMSFSLVWDSDTESDATIKRLVQDNSQLRISIKDGVFRVAPESFNANGTQSTLTALVLEQLA